MEKNPIDQLYSPTNIDKYRQHMYEYRQFLTKTCLLVKKTGRFRKISKRLRPPVQP